MTDNSLDDVLARISPETRSAFLETRSRLYDKHRDNDELIELVAHLDSFAHVIGELRTENTPDFVALNQEARAFKDDLLAIRNSVHILIDISRFRLICFLGLAFILGVIACLAFEILATHLV